MRTLFLFLFFFEANAFFAQNYYSTDDYFNASNPSAFAEKKLYSSNASMYFRMGNLTNFNNFFSLKQQVGAFSFGLNNEFFQWTEWKVVVNTLNTAYSLKINRKLTFNSGIGLSMHRDNMTFIGMNPAPVSSFILWNPPSYSMHLGVSLISKKWTIGLAINNLNRSERTTYPYSYKTPISLAVNGSYRFDLDSAKHFSLTPSLFYQLDVDNHYHDLFLNLKFAAYQHSFGLYSTFHHNIGIFYQYRFKNKFSIGASVNNHSTAFSSNIFQQNYLSGMLRLSYTISPKVDLRFSGTPSF